jgi:hypothetical protein
LEILRSLKWEYLKASMANSILTASKVLINNLTNSLPKLHTTNNLTTSKFYLKLMEGNSLTGGNKLMGDNKHIISHMHLSRMLTSSLNL